MDKKLFDQLVKGVREMKRHVAGKTVRGVKTTIVPTPTWADIIKRAGFKAADSN